MEKKLSQLLACAGGVLLAICLVQSFKIADLKAQLTTLRDSVTTNARQIRTLQATVKRLQSQRPPHKIGLRNVQPGSDPVADETKRAAIAVEPSKIGPGMLASETLTVNKRQSLLAHPTNEIKARLTAPATNQSPSTSKIEDSSQ